MTQQQLSNAGGVALRAWRNGQGKTLEAAGALVGVSKMGWSDWERGNRIPRAEFMARLTALVDGLDAGAFYIAAPLPPVSQVSGRTDSAASSPVPSTAKAA